MGGTDSPARLVILGVIVVSLFSALMARLTFLQVMDSADFQQKAQANQVRFVYEPAPRGRLLDRNGRVIVDNRASQVVTVTRNEIEGNDAAINKLAALLGMPRRDLEKRINDPRFSPFKPVPVAEDVDEATIVYIRENQSDFPGIEATQLALRSYPHGTLAAHVLGYVGEINDQELKQRAKEGYRLGDNIGKNGLEKTFEEELRGQPGVSKLEVDSEGRVLRTLDRKSPVKGEDVRLSIDLDAQWAAEDSLAQGLAAAKGVTDRERRSGFAAPAGSVVVMDPCNGSIIAMASYPTYDPSEFTNGISAARYAELTNPASRFPLTNRAISGQYAPGSTFKIVTALAGLKNGLITAATTINDGGKLQVGNRVFKNAGSRAWGRVNLPRSLTVSSDVYYYQIGENLWAGRRRWGNAIQTTARELGFGERTGIALGSEAAGRVPDPASRKKMHEANPKAFPEGNWFAGDNVNLAIGQGEMLATPLQLGNAYSALANGGRVFTPGFRYQPRDAGKSCTAQDSVNPVKSRIDIPESARGPMLAGLTGVTASGEGTARAAFAGFPIAQIPVAGKTGTAQVARKQDSALFLSFAPASDPQYTISVVMEESGFGGVAAAPVARRIYENLFRQEVSPITLGGGVD